MKLKINQVSDRKRWENIVIRFSNRSFLSSWNWGEVEKKNGAKILRLGVFEGSKIIGAALLVIVDSKKGRFGFCPHGPLFLDDKNLSSKLKFLLRKLSEIGKKEGLSFIRIGSIFNKDKEEIFKKLGLVKSPTHIYTDNFLILDIDKSEDEILARMRKTTRNLIRRAVKEGVEVKKVKDIERVRAFWHLLKKTSARHDFIPFSLKFLKAEFEVFAKDDQVLLFEGWHRGKLIAAVIVVFYGDSGFYHHGASVISKIPVSYLVQWEAIKEAKRRGKKYYNFWGFSGSENINHPFYGITRFKKGFGPEEINCAANYDLPIRKNYWFAYIIDSIRRIKRGH